MLSSISLENFKSFQENNKATLRPITLVYGPNSSGKSSLIQALLLMRQTLAAQKTNFESDLVLKGVFADLGNFASVINRHDITKSLTIGFTFSNKLTPKIPKSLKKVLPDDFFNGISLEYKAIKSTKHTSPILQSVTYLGKNESHGIFPIVMERPKRKINFAAEDYEYTANEFIEDFLMSGISPYSFSGTQENYLKIGEKTNNNALAHILYQTFLQSSNELSLSNTFLRDEFLEKFLNTTESSIRKITQSIIAQRVTGRMDQGYLHTSVRLPNLKPLKGVSTPYLNALSHILRNYEQLLQNSLGSLTYLGPLRTSPARYYILDGMLGESVGSTGEKTVQILFDDFSKSQGRPIVSEINSYFQQFGIPYQISVKNAGDSIIGDLIVLALTDLRTNVEVALSDVGFGIGQLLPILVEGVIAKSSSSRIVCVEQPEIHLHPRLQAEIADFFIETSKSEISQSKENIDDSENIKKGVQWIIETHSEALMLRIQKRIREKVLSPNDVSVIYIHSIPEYGATIEELRLNDDGDFIDPWPQGFFVESYNEIFG